MAHSLRSCAKFPTTVVIAARAMRSHLFAAAAIPRRHRRKAPVLLLLPLQPSSRPQPPPVIVGAVAAAVVVAAVAAAAAAAAVIAAEALLSQPRRPAGDVVAASPPSPLLLPLRLASRCYRLGPVAAPLSPCRLVVVATPVNAATQLLSPRHCRRIAATDAAFAMAGVTAPPLLTCRCHCRYCLAAILHSSGAAVAVSPSPRHHCRGYAAPPHYNSVAAVLLP